MHIIRIDLSYINCFFVFAHYDVKVSGLCWYGGDLCYFRLSNDPWDGSFDPDTDEFVYKTPTPTYNIYALTRYERFKAHVGKGLVDCINDLFGNKRSKWKSAIETRIRNAFFNKL